MIDLKDMLRKAKSLMLKPARGSTDTEAFEDARKKGQHAALLESLSIQPQNQHSVIARIAQLHQDMHHFREAQLYWQQASKLPETKLQDMLNMAECGYEQGQIEDCRQILTDLIETHPSDAELQLRLAQFYLRQRRWIELENVLQDVAKTFDAQRQVEILTFQMYLRQEDYSAAQDLWDRVGRFHQNSGLQEAATLALDSRNLEIAKDRLQELQELDHDSHRRFLEVELRYLTLTRQFDSAVERFRNICGSELAHPLNIARLARLEINAGQINDAMDRIEHIPLIWHRHRQVAPLVSYALSHKGDHQTAKTVWNAIPFWSGVHTEPSITKPIELVKAGAKDPTSQVRLFATLRNERQKLPWFFEYYRSIGITEFYMIDNGSDDGSDKYISVQDDAHLFHSNENFRDNLYATYWLNYLIQTYGNDGWAINADIDEMLVLPGLLENGIGHCIKQLEARGDEAVLAPLLDMYPETIAKGESYQSGDTPLDHSPYFDNSFAQNPQVNCPYVEIQGGSSERFTKNQSVDILTKVPLFRAASGIKMFYICHQLTPAKVSSMTGALLHFKFVGPFMEKIHAEAERGVHFSSGKRYKLLAAYFDNQIDKTLLGPKSVRYENAEQLSELGIISDFQDEEGGPT